MLELGCGTGMPSLVAAALLASSCLLSDSQDSPDVLKNAKVTVMTNNPIKFWHKTAEEGDKTFELVFLSNVRTVPFSWASFDPALLSTLATDGYPDIILASDCFYDDNAYGDGLMSNPSEAFFASLDYLFSKNPQCICLVSYQIRSSQRSLLPLVKKWGMEAKEIPLQFLSSSSSSPRSASPPPSALSECLRKPAKTATPFTIAQYKYDSIGSALTIRLLEIRPAAATP